ncbi:MAG: threonine/serine exporter family protein [Clostridiales Family XIII bacterium]|nr:threonine/serine exporter family protein [Clostridiales Family XIII bacterium]
MINQLQKRILILALFAGELMMKSGAEIYRVEDTIIRICRACNIPYVECFATTTGIFLSLDSGSDDGNMHTFIKRIHRISIDLDKISRINDFSRVFTSTHLSVADGFEMLREIERGGTYSLPVKMLGTGIIGATFCMSLGGSPADALTSAMITCFTWLTSRGIERLQVNPFIRVFMSCVICTLCTLTAVANIPAVNSSGAIIIAAITVFLPGVAITNAARDMLSGDMLSGVARFAEALLTTIAIAVGVGSVMKLWHLIGKYPYYKELTDYPPYALFLFAFFSTLGFCLLFHVPKKHIIAASLIGACGFSLYQYILATGYSVIAASLPAACLVAVLGEIFSRAGKDATTLFIIPGIVPLVPGAGMYNTMVNLLAEDFSGAASTGLQTFIVAGGIAVSLVVVASFTRIIIALRENTLKIAGQAKQRLLRKTGSKRR